MLKILEVRKISLGKNIGPQSFEGEKTKTQYF